MMKKITFILLFASFIVIGYKINSVFNELSGLINYEDYRKLDDFYVVNRIDNYYNTISSGTKGDNEYNIRYKNLDKNVFISLYKVETVPNGLLISLIYGKTNDGWKLHHLDYGIYSIYGKTAIDYYKIAKRYDSLEYLIDAANQFLLAKPTLNRGNKFWQYAKEEEIVDLQISVNKKIFKKYNFLLLKKRNI